MTPSGLQAVTISFPCPGGMALTRPMCSPLSGLPRGRPYDGLFALNFASPQAVIGGTSLLKPRSPHSRHVPPPPFVGLRLHIPDRSCGSNGRLAVGEGAALPLPSPRPCPRPPCRWPFCANKADEKASTATTTIKLINRFRNLNPLPLLLDGAFIERLGPRVFARP